MIAAAQSTQNSARQGQDACNPLACYKDQAPLSGMTEVFIPQGQHKQAIVLPLVASHSNISHQQWLTWITSQHVSAQELIRFGANTATLRIIQQSSTRDIRWIIWEALQTGNSHTVIADCNTLSAWDLAEFEKAANIGKTNGILIRQQAQVNKHYQS